MKLAIALAGLCALSLSACATPQSVRAERPDSTVSFDYGWNDAALCSVRALDGVFASNNLRQYPKDGYAEIVVSSTLTTTETTLVIDFRDAKPGKAVASIRANPWLILPGAASSMAADAIRKCQSAG
jgi:hypothetical protein